MQVHADGAVRDVELLADSLFDRPAAARRAVPAASADPRRGERGARFHAPAGSLPGRSAVDATNRVSRSNPGRSLVPPVPIRALSEKD